MKWALIHLGNDIVYGMTFFANELIKEGHTIYWFDGDNDIINDIINYTPDFVCFGPLSAEYSKALNIAKQIKHKNSNIKTVFGGHHVKAVPQELEIQNCIDYMIVGTCYNIINKIINSSSPCLINGEPANPEIMCPALEDYFIQIPRIGKRSRTYILSHFGCVHNCSYCCTDIYRKKYGIKAYKSSWLTRRPIDNLIKEAKLSKNYGAKEIGINDDDFLYDTQPNGKGSIWIKNFATEWKKYINLSTHINVSPLSVIRAEKSTMKIIANLVDSVQMGLQSINEGSRRIFNRYYQNEELMIKACEILTSYGLKIKMDIIVGCPNINNLVPDPINDAINSIEFCQKLNNKFPNMLRIQCFRLILFPGTKLFNDCIKHNIPTREAWNKLLYNGEGSVIFNDSIENKLKNITKMAGMFVKFAITKDWMEALIETNLNDIASKKLSECSYKDSVRFRLDITNEEINNLVSNMNFQY